MLCSDAITEMESHPSSYLCFEKDGDLEFGISLFVTLSAILWQSHDLPVVTGRENRSTTAVPKSL